MTATERATGGPPPPDDRASTGRASTGRGPTGRGPTGRAPADRAANGRNGADGGADSGADAGQVSIEPLLRSDLERCAELERRLFPGDDPWRASAFAAELDLGHHYLAARVDGQLVGYAGLALLGRTPYLEAEVHTIGVDPDHRRRGIGRRLLRELLAHADAHRATTYLEVRTDNEGAIALYRSEGFDAVGIRRRYYQPSGADAYTMRRPSGGER